MPAGLLTCEAEPSAPLPDSDEPTFWAWVLDAINAGRDCRFKLGQVKGLEAR